MTLTLVRMGLPNAAAVLALAVVPIVAIASAARTDLVRSHGPAVTVAALEAPSRPLADEREQVGE